MECCIRGMHGFRDVYPVSPSSPTCFEELKVQSSCPICHWKLRKVRGVEGTVSMIDGE